MIASEKYDWVRDTNIFLLNWCNIRVLKDHEQGLILGK